MALVRSAGGDQHDEIARLEAAIASNRARVAASIGELGKRLHRATSWRDWVRSHPFGWLGAGLYVGLILGLGSRPVRRPESSRR